MTKTVKRLLCIAGVLIAVGLALCLLAAALADFDLTRLGTEDVVEQELTLTESFDSLFIHLSSHTVRLLPSEDGNCRAVWNEREGHPLTVAVKNGVLRVSEPDTGGFSLSLGFFWGDMEYAVTIYLPGESYQHLTAYTVSGDVNIPSDFRFQSVRLESTSGNLCFLAQTEQSLSMESTSGDLKLTGVSPAQAELNTTSGEIRAHACWFSELDASTVSGDILLEDCRGKDLGLSTISGNLFATDTVFSGKAQLGTTSGDVRFQAFDAGELSISTTSGDLTGTLLSGKNFRWETVSGTVSLPPSSGSGPCEIQTVSGDINLETAA